MNSPSGLGLTVDTDSSSGSLLPSENVIDELTSNVINDLTSDVINERNTSQGRDACNPPSPELLSGIFIACDIIIVFLSLYKMRHNMWDIDLV